MRLEDIKCGLGVSSIHGIGVIALRNIEKGERLYAHEIEHEWYKAEELISLPEDIQKYIRERWPSVLDNSDFVYPFDILICHMNHSDTPNYDTKTDRAIKNIKKGEEVTEDYGKYKDIIVWKQ